MARDTGLGPAGACDAKAVWPSGPAHSTERGRRASAGMEMGSRCAGDRGQRLLPLGLPDPQVLRGPVPLSMAESGVQVPKEELESWVSGLTPVLAAALLHRTVKNFKRLKRHIKEAPIRRHVPPCRLPPRPLHPELGKGAPRRHPATGPHGSPRPQRAPGGLRTAKTTPPPTTSRTAPQPGAFSGPAAPRRSPSPTTGACQDVSTRAAESGPC